MLEEKQLLHLVAYIVGEAASICNMQNRNAALAKMYVRLDLLLHCISTEDKLILPVVIYLAERMMMNDWYKIYNYMCIYTCLRIYRYMYTRFQCDLNFFSLLVFFFSMQLGL